MNFVDEVKGGAIPKEYIPAVNKGVQRTNAKTVSLLVFH